MVSTANALGIGIAAIIGLWSPPVTVKTTYTCTHSVGERLITDGLTHAVLVTVVRTIWIAPDGSGRIVEDRSSPLAVDAAQDPSWFGETGTALEVDRTYGAGGLYVDDLGRLPATNEDLTDLLRREVAPGPDGGYALAYAILGHMRESAYPAAMRSRLIEILEAISGAAVARVGPLDSIAISSMVRPRHLLGLLVDRRNSTILVEEESYVDPVPFLRGPFPVLSSAIAYTDRAVLSDTSSRNGCRSR